MSKSLNPRVEWDIKDGVEKIAQGEWTISDTAAKLLHIGIAVREADAEPQIEGPFGLPRPFAEISLSDRMTELRTEVNDEIAERLTDEFDAKPNTAARQAVRLGVMAAASDQFKINGPEGGPRPFAGISIEGLNDPKAREYLEQIRQRL